MRTALLPRSFSRDGSSVPLLRPCSFARHIARRALCYRDLRVPNYMLANDSNEGKNQSEFFLVIRPHQAVAELMAECPSCGAITSFALELAWQLDVVSCSECNRAMRLDEYELEGFRNA